MQTLLYKLEPKQPFDFQKTLDFLKDFKADGISRSIEGNRLSFALSSDHSVIHVALEPEDKILLCHLTANNLNEAQALETIDALKFYLGLEDDMNDFYTRAKQDLAFKPVLESLYGYHQVKYPSVFCCACWALVTQRTPNSFAYKTMERLCHYLGQSITIEDKTFWAFPDPQAFLADKASAAILEASNNVRKTERLLKIAEAFARVRPAFFRESSYEELAKWLKSIHGLGDWSVDYIMLRGLGRRERSPWTDTDILNAISKSYTSGFSVSLGDAKKLAEMYGWNQGYWVHYLKLFHDS
ncbi:MAG: DNA-3-methyladenine glycosylase 2 family protein [Trueperaceae bacterium]|nr:DNA-3-methyladenine glycosylase 2 family protein [Trueperaceae bacterium]